ncbi:hypothetical protein, partial [Amantichitinum ursilacus]|uniref:hypothetical protein n=1 Tax=Amantichitinum ursilacus TaxID=857265 RepID=UPI001F31AFA7
RRKHGAWIEKLPGLRQPSQSRAAKTPGKTHRRPDRLRYKQSGFIAELPLSLLTTQSQDNADPGAKEGAP